MPQAFAPLPKSAFQRQPLLMVIVFNSYGGSFHTSKSSDYQLDIPC